MTISIQINIPDDEINEGPSALQKRMAVLGYASNGATKIYEPQLAPPYSGEAVTLGEAMRAEQAAEQPKEEPKKRGRKKAEEPQIRANPEARVEPEAVDDEDTAAQDEADEQAEVDANREPETPVTIEDLKGLVGDYVKAHGIPAAKEDGPKIFEKVLGARADGSAWTFPLLAELPADKMKAVWSEWQTAVKAGKRYG